MLHAKLPAMYMLLMCMVPYIPAADNPACAAKAHPDVPVVENLEDIWLVNKLQQERKAKEKELQQAAHQQQCKDVKQVVSNSQVFTQ